MGRYIGFLVVALVVLTAGFLAPQQRATSEPTRGHITQRLEPASNKASFAPGRILVKIKDDAPVDAIDSVNRKNDAHIKEKIPHTQISVVDLPNDLSVAEAVKRYENSPDVEYAEPDFLLQPTETVNDPSYPKMYDLNNTGQYDGTEDSDIDATQAWNVTTGSANTVVAIIDTGVDINHPDLKNNIWTNPGESGIDNKGKDKATNGVDDDRNGYVDDVHGWDFANDDNSVFDSASEDAHATHVAGTIAAEGNNGTGVTGVNWSAKVMPLKFIKFQSDGRLWGYTSDAATALKYALAKGVKISNNSWGGDPYSQTLFDMIQQANGSGHLFVAAAGNGGRDLVGDNNDATPFYPASYDSPNIISVAASNNDDNLASFSNYGPTSVDLAAPGQWIYSTLPGNTYGYYDGTSMATPHVAGAAALIKSAFPDLNSAEIKTRILSSVDHRKHLQDKLLSGGRLNAARALGINVPPPPSSAPYISVPRPHKTHDRTPTISLKVSDAQTNITKANVKNVSLDGRRITHFSYNAGTNKLIFKPMHKLSYKRHRVKINAEDPQGLTRTKTGKIRVVR